jgi:hypothetical protein
MWAMAFFAMQQRQLLPMLLCGPLSLLWVWTLKHRIQYVPSEFFSLEKDWVDDAWCYRMLRFSKQHVRELAFILNIPERYGNHIR